MTFRNRKALLAHIGCVLIAALGLTACSDPGTPAAPASESTELLRDPRYPVRVQDVGALAEDVIIENDVAVLVRDGTRLSAKVFRPKAPGRYPVVMALTAYDKDKGPDQYPSVLRNALRPDFDLGTFTVSPWATWEGPDPAFWVAAGYAVVYLDSRGYHGSAGQASILSMQDREDFYDAIEWAGTQPWSNGNVGLNGVSYLAISQWVAASGNPPHLKAIIPWEGQSDSFREVLYHGGMPETAFTRFWFNRMRGLAHDSPLPPAFIFQFVHGRPMLMKWFQDNVQDPSGIDLPSIRVPALICATWSDQGLHTRGAFNAFRRIGSEQKWLFTHGRPKWSTYYSDEALQYQKDFFDHFLKGLDNGFDRRSPVRLEVREGLNDYAVRNEDSWPPEDTTYRKLFLNAADGTLSETPSGNAAVVDYDPHAGRAEFALRFEADTELSGHMKLKLWVSTDAGNDLDLFVAVEKRDRAGEPVHFYAKTGYTRGPVALGWLRVSQRELDEARSTPWQPVLAHRRSLPVSAQEIVPVEIEILPSSTLFRAGESLVLIVQGRDLFEHPALAHTRSVNAGRHRIHTGATHDAHLLVPVVPGRTPEGERVAGPVAARTLER